MTLQHLHVWGLGVGGPVLLFTSYILILLKLEQVIQVSAVIQLTPMFVAFALSEFVLIRTAWTKWKTPISWEQVRQLSSVSAILDWSIRPHIWLLYSFYLITIHILLLVFVVFLVQGNENAIYWMLYVYRFFLVPGQWSWVAAALSPSHLTRFVSVVHATLFVLFSIPLIGLSSLLDVAGDDRLLMDPRSGVAASWVSIYDKYLDSVLLSFFMITMMLVYGCCMVMCFRGMFCQTEPVTPPTEVVELPVVPVTPIMIDVVPDFQDVPLSPKRKTPTEPQPPTSDSTNRMDRKRTSLIIIFLLLVFTGALTSTILQCQQTTGCVYYNVWSRWSTPQRGDPDYITPYGAVLDDPIPNIATLELTCNGVPCHQDQILFVARAENFNVTIDGQAGFTGDLSPPFISSTTSCTNYHLTIPRRVALVDGYGCSTCLQLFNAQDAGATAMIISDNLSTWRQSTDCVRQYYINGTLVLSPRSPLPLIIIDWRLHKLLHDQLRAQVNVSLSVYSGWSHERRLSWIMFLPMLIVYVLGIGMAVYAAWTEK